MICRKVADLGAFGPPEGVQQNMRDQVDDHAIAGMLAVHTEIGCGISPGFLNDKLPVAIAMMVFDEEFPCLLLFARKAMDGFNEDLEKGGDFHLDVGQVHVFRQSVGLDAVRLQWMIHVI